MKLPYQRVLSWCSRDFQCYFFFQHNRDSISKLSKRGTLEKLMHPNNHTPQTHTSDISICVVVMDGTCISVKHLTKAVQTLRARKDYNNKQGAHKKLPFGTYNTLKLSLIVKLSSWMTSLLNNHVIIFQKLVLEEILLYPPIPQRLEVSQMKAKSRPISRWDRGQENDRLQRQDIGHNFLVVGDVSLFCHGMTVKDI